MIRRNPTKIPAHLILDPLAPVPASLGKKDRAHLQELREAYQYSLQSRFMGASCQSPDAVAALLAPLIQGQHVEGFHVLGCNPKMKLIAPPVTISRGSTDGVDAPIREILRAVLVMEATSFIVAHNHPSGSTDPSQADIAVTRRIIAAGRAVDCPLNDHLIIGYGGGYRSLRRDDPELFR